MWRPPIPRLRVADSTIVVADLPRPVATGYAAAVDAQFGDPSRMHTDA